MLVKVLKFGSDWWARFGQNPEDLYRYTRRAAYFNSTGLTCGKSIRRYWVIPGLIRFNGAGDFNPHFPNRSIGSTFECTDLDFRFGGYRIVLVRKASRLAIPDYFLSALSSDHHGLFNWRTPGWDPDSVVPIAVSQSRDRQEALLLMRSGAWVRTLLGVWELRVDATPQKRARLELIEEGVPA